MKQKTSSYCVGVAVAMLAAPTFSQNLQPLNPANETVPPLPPDAPEGQVFAQIKKLEQLRVQERGPGDKERQIKKILTLCETVDILVARFPESTHKDEALSIKLATLAELARYREEYLAQLLAMNERIASSQPSPQLAAENAYFAIEGFVLGARLEKMPEDRRLAGAIERYGAFIQDYPNSARRPIVWASLVRNLLEQKQWERATQESEKLKEAFPENIAAHRARGEVFRATAIGKPIDFQFTGSGDETLRVRDYRGKTLVIHAWASWRKPALEQFAVLQELAETHKGDGLELVGICIDQLAQRMESALKQHPLPWKQFLVTKGTESPALLEIGIQGVPTYLIVDREGVLRGIDDGTNLERLVKEALGGSAKGSASTTETAKSETPAKPPDEKGDKP